MYRQRLSLVAFVLLLAVPVFAQKFTSQIRGTVTDPTGAAVSSAKVTLTNEGTGVSRTMNTNAQGNYAFPDIPVGSYKVEVEFAGFKTAVQSKIQAIVGEVRVADVKLETGAITETVSVEYNAGVAKVGAEISGIVEGEQVRELPLNGRNFLQLTLLQPGVTAQEGLNTVNKRDPVVDVRPVHPGARPQNDAGRSPPDVLSSPPSGLRLGEGCGRRAAALSFVRPPRRLSAPIDWTVARQWPAPLARTMRQEM
jgi:hypothetical protein